MNVTYVGGTPQQRQWVLDALSASSYPYSDLDVAVAVTWAASTPCGVHHSYMCTTDHGDGTFTITIASDADDPRSDKVQGLANPVTDIKRFYMESFVHETGHVVHFTLINNDGLRTQAAELFWAAVVNDTGRVYGTLADYSLIETTSITWADSIIEAIAETIKVAFYQGNLIYGNRTAWHVDKANWSALMALLLPASGGGGFVDQLTDATAHPYTVQGGEPGQSGWSVGGTGQPAGFWLDPNPSGWSASQAQVIGEQGPIAGDAMVSMKIEQVFVGVAWELYAEVWTGAWNGDALSGAQLAFVRLNDGNAYVYLDYSSGGPSLSLGTADYLGSPLWLVWRVVAGEITHELWEYEPDTTDNSGALFTVSGGQQTPSGAVPAYFSAQARNGTAGPPDTPTQFFVLADWRYTPLGQPLAAPPYPYAPSGQAIPGPGATGMIAISR